MIEVKNVRPGILLIADAGLKLAPGGTASAEKLTVQMERCLEDGLLARIDPLPETKPEAKANAKPENKPKGKAAGDSADSKEIAKRGKAQPAEEEQTQASEDSSNAGTDDAKPEEQPKETGQAQLLETDDAPK